MAVRSESKTLKRLCAEHQYITNALRHTFGGTRQVCYDSATSQIIYSFVELCPNLYIDAVGVFRNPYTDRFETAESPVTICPEYYTQDVEIAYKEHGIVWTDSKNKNFAREFVVNNIPVLMCEMNGALQYIGLVGRTPAVIEMMNGMGVCAFLYRVYNEKTKKFEGTVQKIWGRDLVQSFRGSIGYVYAPNWYYKQCDKAKKK